MSALPETESGRFTLRIDSLAHGGEGVGRLEGCVVFVPGVAPGDLIRAELVGEGKRELRARLVELIEPGPDRVSPVCPHYERCGGCQWQHLDIEAQRAAKQQTLRESLARVGRVPRDEIPQIEVLASPQPLRYRRRARLHLAKEGRLGYIGREGHEVVEVRSCHLLTTSLEGLVLSLSQAMVGWPQRKHVRSIEVCEASGRGAFWLELEGFEGDPRPAVAALLGRLPAFTGAVIRQGDRWTEIGEVVLSDGDGLIRPDSFAQANLAASEALVARALASLAPTRADRTLELYCGDGNFTLPMARLAREVVAVDSEGKSLALLRRRAKDADLHNVVVLAEDVQRAVERFRAKGERFEVALLDPPRTGAKAIMAGLAPLVSRRVVYVSCDPATLSRDVALLRGHGYRLTELAMVDLFPQTYHLEAIATLERGAAR